MGMDWLAQELRMLQLIINSKNQDPQQITILFCIEINVNNIDKDAPEYQTLRMLGGTAVKANGKVNEMENLVSYEVEEPVVETVEETPVVEEVVETTETTKEENQQGGYIIWQK